MLRSRPVGARCPRNRYAADHHREEQLGEEDRRHPQRRRGEGRRHLQGAVLHLERRRRRADDRRAQGPRDGRRLPGGLLELAGDRPARPDRRRAGARADRQERGQGHPQAGQGGGLDRDRDRLRPRGRADRARGAAAGAGGQPAVAGGRARRLAPADRPRPLLGADQGRDRARLLEPRRALLRPRLRRLRAPGHRPDLGRDPDPRRLACHAAASAPTSSPSAASRARPWRWSSSASSSAAPTCRSPTGSCSRSSTIPTAPSRPTTRPTSSGSEAEADAALAGTKSPGVVKEVSSRRNTAQAADPAQHHRLHHRRLEPARDHPGGGDADRRGPLHGRLHLLPAHRQHGLSALAATRRSWSPRWSGSPTSRPPRACSTAR